MPKYYVAGIPFDSEDCLKHYGVKGMKWNQHIFGIDANDKYINWLKDAGQNIGKFTNRAANTVSNAATSAARAVGGALNKSANFVTGNQARENLNNAKANAANVQSGRSKVNDAYARYDQLRNSEAQHRTAANGWRESQANRAPLENFGRNQDRINADNEDRRANRDANRAEIAKMKADRMAERQRNAETQARAEAKNAQQAYDRTLPGAAENASRGAQGFLNSAGKWVSTAAGNAGKGLSDAVNQAGQWLGDRAQDVGNAATDAWNGVTDAASQAGQWIGDRANDVGKAAGSAVNAVGNAANDAGQWIGDRARDVGNWFTGGDKGQQAADLREQAKALQERGDAMVDQGVKGISDSIYAEPPVNMSPDNSAYAQSAKDNSEAMFQKGLSTRNQGYDLQDDASAFRNQAAHLQSAYDAAPRQQLRAGAEAVGNAASNAVNAIGNATNDAGQWIGDRARETGAALGNAAESAKDWATNALDDITGKNRARENHSNQMRDYASEVIDPSYSSRDREKILRDMISAEDNAISKGVANDRFFDGNTGGAIRNNLDMIDYLMNQIPNTPSSSQDKLYEYIEDLRNQNQMYLEAILGSKYPDGVRIRHSDISDISDKPEGVGEAFWKNYIAHGGTREDYERDWR